MPQTILILAANPRQDLKLGREIRDLQKVVKRSGQRDQFEVEIALAVRPEDLQELFLEYKPWVVHFCGHGSGEQGLILGEEGGEQLVSTEAITHLCKLFASHVNCVLLNACDTDQQAKAMVQHTQLRDWHESSDSGRCGLFFCGRVLSRLGLWRIGGAGL
jgi:hypothetical protein